MSDEADDREEEPPTDFLSALTPTGPTPAQPSGPPQPSDPAQRPDPAQPSIDELDPDIAIVESERWRPPRLPEPVIDTRKYQYMIGGVGLAIVIALSIFLFAHGKSGLPGLAPGQRMTKFVAPLATSDLASVASNAHPFCNPARPSHRGLNVCDRRPIVLAFFALGSPTSACVKQVDALQAVSAEFPQVQFGAVAVSASKAATAKLVRQQGWTIQVAYDLTGIIGQVYGVEVCPLVELARTGGKVQQRLIGSYWENPSHLASAVRKLVG